MVPAICCIAEVLPIGFPPMKVVYSGADSRASRLDGFKRGPVEGGRGERGGKKTSRRCGKERKKPEFKNFHFRKILIKFPRLYTPEFYHMDIQYKKVAYKIKLTN